MIDIVFLIISVLIVLYCIGERIIFVLKVRQERKMIKKLRLFLEKLQEDSKDV